MKCVILAGLSAIVMSANAQSNRTKEQCFTALNKIVKKSVGEKFLSGIFNERSKLHHGEIVGRC